MTDDEYNELFKRWASYKYGVPRDQIEEVTMSLGTTGPYSPETPDVYAHVDIRIKAPGWHGTNNFGYIEREYDEPTQLIKDILSFEAKMRGKKVPKRTRRTA